MSDDTLRARMLAELSSASPVHLTIGAAQAVQIADCLKRSAESRDASPAARRAYKTVYDHIRLQLHDHPAVLEALERGIDGIKKRS